MHPRMQRLVFAATVVALTACGRDVPVSPTDILAPSEEDGTTANYAVILADGTTQITVGEAVTLRASTSVRRSRTIRWSSTNTSVVSVSSVGTITGRAAGAATVTALGSNGSRSTFPISVISTTNRTAPVVARVDITAPATSVAIGGTLALSATARDSAGVEVTGKTVSWSASTGSALSVSTVGVVTALATGTQDVRATVDGVVGTRTITVGGATPSVTSFVLSPKTGASLTQWQNRQFTSSVTWSDAGTRAVSVTYSTNGGYIDSNGWFTAGGIAGTFMVIANCACGRADTAAVIVSSTTTTPTAQLTKLTISPKSVSLAAGASQQFSATANWSTGATTLPPMTYSASAGSVSASGLYLAPSTAGTYRVIVAHTGGSLRDTATIVVGGGNPNDVVTPPPPGQPWSITRDFNTGVVGANAQRTSDGFDDAAGRSNYSAEQSVDGGQSAKLTIEQGADGWGLWGGVVNFPTALTAGSDFWLQLYVYIPADFAIVTPGNGSLKFIRIRTKTSTGANGGFNDIQLQDDASQESSFRMIKEVQDRWFQFGAANSFGRGTWQRITVNLRLHSTPKALGGFAQTRVWQNGQLLVDETRMQTLSNPTDFADALYLFTYWNGNSPRTQSLWVDKIQMANYLPAWSSDLQGIAAAQYPNPL